MYPNTFYTSLLGSAWLGVGIFESFGRGKLQIHPRPLHFFASDFSSRRFCWHQAFRQHTERKQTVKRQWKDDTDNQNQFPPIEYIIVIMTDEINFKTGLHDRNWSNFCKLILVHYHQLLMNHTFFKISLWITLKLPSLYLCLMCLKMSTNVNIQFL